jgi:diguanylate cyclase (GGDEF)-like protein
MPTDHANQQTPGPGRLRIVPVRSWALWERPRRVLVYVLAVELATVLFTFGSLEVREVTSTDLIRALTIWACAAAYIEATRPIERIRERTNHTPHTDLNSVWTFSAILLVHPALVAVIVFANYLHRWLRVRHHVPHRQTFSASATTLGGFAAIGVLATADQHPALTGPSPTFANYLLIMAAVATYFVVSTGLVFGAIALSTPRATLTKLRADPGDSALELAGIGLGVLIAWALVAWPAALTIILGVSLVLHGKVLVRQLRKAASTDPKTGLLNLPAWSSAAQQHMNDVDADRSVGLLMVDLDHFKLVNDVYGHLLGDDVLMAVAMAINDEVRAKDVVGRADLVGRFGGEEFVILLQDANETDAVAVAERIRRRVGSITVHIPDDDATANRLTQVTCSIGAAIYPHHGASIDQLIQAADDALNAAKRSGRNQVRLAHAT